MLKSLGAIAAGDWVVLTQHYSACQISEPWKVLKIVGGQVDLIQPKLLHWDQHFLESRSAPGQAKSKSPGRRRTVPLGTLKFIFSDETSAQAVVEFAKQNYAAYEQQMAELKRAFNRKFDDYVAAMPLQADPAQDD